MHLGSSLIGDPFIADGYKEISNLDTLILKQPSSISTRKNVSSSFNQSVASNSMTHIRSCYEAEDISTYERGRTIRNSTGSLCGIGGSSSSSAITGLSRYFSPPASSYAIFDRPHSPNFYTTSHKTRRFFFEGLNTNSHKKKFISPERLTLSAFPSAYQYFPTNDNPLSVDYRASYNFHQNARDRLMVTKTVTMCQPNDGANGFGICVKGGRETGIGVYISRIEENSVAEKAGLRPGDTILEVNGTLFSGISHDEALGRCVQILKSSRQITMTVSGPPLCGPPARAADVFKSSSPMTGALLSPPSRPTCSWMDRNGRPASPPYEGRRSERRERVRRVELVIEPGQSLGLMIRGGIEYGLGIFVTGVDKDSVADLAGLNIGDQILEVNGQSFMNVTHDEAVNQFKFHKRMSLVVRDVGKVPHSCTTTMELEQWDVGRKKCPVSVMVEEKARSLLPRHQFSNISFYIREYCARGLTIEAFVSILLEMLDTPEKHTLVTEIRELVFPEDRPRYDELVYCCNGGGKLKSRTSYYDLKRSMHRQPTDDSDVMLDGSRNQENSSQVVPDEKGNLFITIQKTKPILGIAIEGGANTKHPLPRIINIHEHGAAYEAGGLEVGQLILEVDRNKVEGMQHQDVARLIAECYANRDRNEITFLVVEAKKSNLEPKPTALVFLEQ